MSINIYSFGNITPSLLRLGQTHKSKSGTMSSFERIVVALSDDTGLLYTVLSGPLHHVYSSDKKDPTSINFWACICQQML